MAIIIAPLVNNAQVGIETDFPRSPLTVKGVIQSTQDGFQFPDGSLQQKAAAEAVPATAAEGRLVAVMEIQGIPGSYNGMGFQDAMRVYDFEWGFFHYLVPDSLLYAGPRIHKMLTITKDFDFGTVQLIQRGIDGNVIPSLNLNFLVVGGSQPVLYYTIELTTVRVVRFDQELEHKGDETELFAHMERISFSFEEISWEYDEGTGAVIYQDDLTGGGPADGIINY
jgi:type VI secretion system Hcp family effector